MSIRRSSRLNPAGNDTVVVQIPKTKKRRVETPICTISQREKALQKREEDLQRKSDRLDERIITASKKEKEVSLLMGQFELQAAKATLDQLEEHFMCSLCYEVMACPYSLNPGQCGHTFCAICILRWFFSRLHPPCGTWHEPVDCPICRAMLVATPDRVPRLDFTFPFTPNRTADTLIQALVGRLASSPVGKKKRKDATKEEEERDDALRQWKVIGGKSSIDWKARDRDGRLEMSILLANWSTLRAEDFIRTKHRLGV